MIFHATFSFKILSVLNIKIKMSDSDSDIEHYVKSISEEAKKACKQIKFATKQAFLSTSLPITNDIAYFNIETLESNKYCIELTASSYTIVANIFDTIDENFTQSNLNRYETIDALINSISPLYTQSFNESLANKLKNLF